MQARKTEELSMAASPFVYWAQNEMFIFLRIDLRDLEDPVIEVNDSSVNFQAIATGARGRKEYSFQLDLFAEVETAQRDVDMKNLGRHVQMTLSKTKMGWWPQLVVGDKPHWLKIDFDKWKDPDESDGDDQDREPAQMTPEQEMDEMTKKLLFDFDKANNGKRPMSLDEAVNYVRYFQTTYLVVYNFALFLGHFLVVVELLFGFIAYGTDYFDSFWRDVLVRVKICTVLQYFDVIHSLFRLTKSGYKAALVQITGRLAMIFIIDGNPHLHSAATTYCLVVTWFLIELFRYPYYAFSVKKINIDALTWLRYSAWIPLYPAGLCLEAISMIRSIPFYYSSETYSIALPNRANIAFNFGTFLAIFLVCAFLPISVFLLGHMRRQRATKLNNILKKAS